jgi:hypothetical protein
VTTIPAKLQRDIIRSWPVAYLEFESEPWSVKDYKAWLRDVYIPRNPEHIDMLSVSAIALGWYFRVHGQRWSAQGFRVVKYEKGRNGSFWRLEKEDVIPPDLPVDEDPDLLAVRLIAQVGGEEWTFNLEKKIRAVSLTEILDDLVSRNILLYSFDGSRVHLAMRKLLIDHAMPDRLRKFYPDDETIARIRHEWENQR